MDADRPLLLIDVDGPLNPYAARWFVKPVAADGYTFHRLTPATGETFKVALARWHGDRLRELAASADLVWASTWQHDANRLISPILGLPGDPPVLPLSTPLGWRSRRCWKTEQVLDWVGRRRFAWIDDEINRATRDWLSRGGAGDHLALRIEPHIGLTGGDFHRLARFFS